jgi:uncharacterized protein involved in exopolysaccharide biosynthesis
MTVYDDEIDLRPYVQTLIQNWWKIALLAFLAAVAALIFILQQTRQYEATASILLTRTRAQLALAQQFPTVTEPVDARSRMDAMLSIAQSDALALAAYQNVADRLPEEEREFAPFKGRVEITSSGDIILVTASAADPHLAAEIANTWARDAATAINQAYSNEQPLAEIQGQLVVARAEYEAAKVELEIFTRDNQIDLLQKRIDEGHTLFSGLAAERPWQIAYYTDRRLVMENLGTQAEALKRQLEIGNQSTAGGIGDALAVLRARLSALAIRDGSGSITGDVLMDRRSDHPTGTLAQTPTRSSDVDGGLTINIDIGEMGNLLDTPANYMADLEAIIQLSREEAAAAQAALDALGQEVLSGSGYETIEAIDAQIRALQTQLQREEARKLELTSQRDLAWQAYQAIAQKETEIKNAPTTGNQVNLASYAVPPENPTSRGTLRNALVAGVLGGLLATAWVFAAQWWRTSAEEDLVTRPAQLGSD